MRPRRARLAPRTLFHDRRVVYVVAADRRWLHAAFEKVYEQFAASVKEPGRRLGSLFLEKAFELSVSLPRLSPKTQADFWDYLNQPAAAQSRAKGRRRRFACSRPVRQAR